MIYSRFMNVELEPAPERVRNLVTSLPEQTLELIDVSVKAIELGDEYLKANVVGKASRSDCISACPDL